MKRSFFWALLILLLGLPLACAVLPTPRPEDLPRATGRWPNVRFEDLQEGRKLMLENCAACHALHLPSEYTTERWDKIMEKMQKKAKIDDHSRDSILMYMAAFSKVTP